MIRHVEGDRFSLGEPSGEKTRARRALAEALVAAGLKAPVRADIRDEIWVKLWGNLSFNPISRADRRDAGGDRRRRRHPRASRAR